MVFALLFLSGSPNSPTNGISRHCGSRGGGVGGQGLRSAGRGSGQRGARQGCRGGRQWQGSFHHQVMKESSKGVVIGDRKPGKAHPIRSNREAGSGYDVNVSFSRTGRSTRKHLVQQLRSCGARKARSLFLFYLNFEPTCKADQSRSTSQAARTR